MNESLFSHYDFNKENNYYACKNVVNAEKIQFDLSVAH